jgi:hypothetical protein
LELAIDLFGLRKALVQGLEILPHELIPTGLASKGLLSFLGLCCGIPAHPQAQNGNDRENK